jgi:hypothetical protein
MRNLILSVVFFAFSFSGSFAARHDTLTPGNYLKLFNNSFTSDYNPGGVRQGNKNKMILSFEKSKQLDSLWVKSGNGKAINPKISGWAYSYRKINDHLFWLIYYTEGESGTSFLLCVFDTRTKTFSKPYQLANAFGDQGDWAYKYGKFVNDSTYNYLHVFGDQEKTIDSISGQDRIRLNGEFMAIQKKKLLK